MNQSTNSAAMRLPEPGERPGPGLGQTEPLARIVVGSLVRAARVRGSGPDSQDPIARAILSG